MSECSCCPGDSALVVTANAPDHDRLDPAVWRIAAIALFGDIARHEPAEQVGQVPDGPSSRLKRVPHGRA